MKYFNISKDMFVYGLGGVLARSVSIFLLPIYTNYFTPSEYASFEILVIITNIIGALMMLGMDSAQSMYFFKYKNKGKIIQSEIVSSILQFRLIWSFGIVILSTMISPMLNSIFFFGKFSWEHFLFAFLSIVFMQIMSQSAELMRLMYRPWKYIQIISIQSWLAAILIIVFLLTFDSGIKGIFFGILFASIVASLFGWYQIKEYINFKKLHINWWAQLIRFGAPFVPIGLAIYLMNIIDRWFLLEYQNTELLGIFAAGAKISYLMALVVEVFRKAFWPYALQSINGKNGKTFFRKIARIYFAFSSVAIIILTLLSPLISQFFLGEEFREGWKIVGVLAWQGIAYGAFMIFSGGIWKAEKTYLNIYLMILGLVAAVILNWLLVPPFGIMGAAIGTALANLIWVSLCLLISQKFWKISYDVNIFIFQIVTSSIFIFLFLYFYSLINFIIIIIFTLLLSLILIFSGFNKIERNNISNFFYKFIIKRKYFKI